MDAGKDELPVLKVGGSTTPPSIFNDVIGPVMRGPSSSHCAAAVRIGRLARDLMGGELERVLVEFHPGGSLATTHESQGSDMGLFGGLLGWDATDHRLVESPEAIRKAGVEVEIRVTDFPATHPNTYRLSLENARTGHRMTAVSTGGGMIQILKIDGVALSMAGDYHETLVFMEGQEEEAAGIPASVSRDMEADEVLVHACPAGGEGPGPLTHLVQIKAQRFPSPGFLEEVRGRAGVLEVRTLSPALPVHSRKGMTVPFLTARELLEHGLAGSSDLWEMGALYESERGGISAGEVLDRMESIVRLLEEAVKTGLAGTEYADRILGAQSGSFRERMVEGDLLDGGSLNRMILYVTALMEVKSSMGVIVAAPTAGACGALPGACLGAAHTLGLTRRDMARAMLAAGLVGVFIAAGSTFAAEVCGCQAECGAGSGMAAAALVSLAGGTTEQALAAASMALQNTLGMICDPVANRVEVPCLGRNVLAASNALACANMALSDFDPVIPLDEVIQTMDEVGKSLPHQLRCTALGGLSITETSKRIEKGLDPRARMV